MEDLKTLFDAVLPVVRRAGAYVRTAVPHAVQEKSGHTDLVTEYDVNTQRMLVEQLSALYPAARFVGEEDHLSTESLTGDCFVIDPIDGTTNFVMGYEHSAVSVALLRDGVPMFGAVYQPWTDQMYSAFRGGGAFCNGAPLRVSNRAFADSVINFGTATYYPDLRRRTVRAVDKILEVAVDVRRRGSAALELCDVACGRCGAFFELRLSPWDYAAAGLLVTEAGGEITDVSGAPVSMTSPSSVVAGSPENCAALRRILAEV